MNERTVPTVDDDIRQIVKDLEEIKQAQLIGGDSWLFYRIVSGNQPDVTVDITGSGVVKLYRITFTPDETDKDTAAKLYISYDSDFSHRLQLYPTQGANHQWDMRITSDAATLHFIATFLIESTQHGTFSIVQIA